MKKNNFILFLLLLIAGKLYSQDLNPSVFTKEVTVNLNASAAAGTVLSGNFTFDKNTHFPSYTAKTLKYARTYIEVYPAVMPLTTGASALTGSMTVSGRNVNSVNENFYDNVSNPASQVYSVTINNNTPSAVIYNDFTNQYTSANPSLIGLSFSFNYANSFTSTDIITIKIRLEVAYNLNVNENPALLIPLTTALKPTFNPSAPRVATFSWGTGGRYYPAYQLQVLRLYNKDASVTEPAISSTADWSKAMTLNIENDLINTLNGQGMVAYNYTIAEGTGLYVWRVRPVGNFSPGGFANSTNYGTNWSIPVAEGAPVSLLNFKLPTDNGYFYFTDPNENTNWIYSRVFTEKTSIKESISYAGYLLHKKQTQTYLPSKRATIMMQYIMDYMGRPAITTIPVPQQYQLGLLGYKTNFVQNTVGTLFRSIDFDSDASSGSPTTIKIKSTNGFEYYANNPIKSIPNSGEFPYSRAVFENSTNSRIIEQSGVGINHSIGSGHTTRTLYSTASDDELVRVLGDEAPKGSKVLKTTSIDPNKTATITYTDMSGKVIATCLSFNDNDVANTADPVSAGSNFTVNETLDNNISVSDGMLSSKRISLNTATTLTLSYEIPCSEVVKLCGIPAEAVCVYKLLVTIHDLKQPSNRLQAEELLEMKNCTGGKFTISLPASKFHYVDQPGKPVATSLQMNAGDYIIEKRLVFERTDNETLTKKALASVQSKLQAFVLGITAELENTKTETEYNAFLNKYKCAIVQPVCTGNPASCTFTLIPDNTVDCSMTANEALDQFKISIRPINPLLPYSKMFNLTSACCNIDVPVEFIPPLVCPDVMPTDPNYDYGFYEYAQKFLEAKGLSLHNDSNFFMNKGTELWGVFGNKTTADAELDKMIYHMIHDEYAPNQGGTAAKQYTCQNLAKCWTAALNAVTEFDPATVEDKNTTDTGDDLNFDSLFDDMPGGGILKLFVGKKKKAKIKNEVKTKSQTAAQDGLDDYSGPSLVESLLDCAEYKYASVLVLLANGETSPFASTSCNTIPSTVLAGNELTLFNTDPNAFWRIYNFKYIPYFPGGNLRQYNCEAATCFCPAIRKAACVPYVAGYADGGPCYDDDEKQYDLCDPAKNHTDWSFINRLKFAECIKDATYPAPNTITTILPNDAGESDNYTCDQLKANTDTDFMTVADLRAELFNMQGNCQGDCEENEELYKQKIRNMFTLHCYNIVSTACELGPNDVPEKDIEMIVEQFILQCKSMCDISYLAARTHTCVQCEINGQPTRQYVELIMGSAREKLLLNMAREGNFDLDIESRCSEDFGQVNCDLANMAPSTGSGFSNPCGKDYVKPLPNQDPESFFCLPQNFDPNLTPCALDQLDPNNLSQPIKVRVEVE